MVELGWRGILKSHYSHLDANVSHSSANNSKIITGSEQCRYEYLQSWGVSIPKKISHLQTSQNLDTMTSSHSSSISEAAASCPLPSKWDSKHTTLINAPISFVWECLVSTHSWQWNHCIRLKADVAQSGKPGTAKVRIQGNRWASRSFVFQVVDRSTFTFAWRTSMGACRVTNTVQLRPSGPKSTFISHCQVFDRIFLGMRWLVPLRKMMSHPLCMNEGLKNHAEKQFFTDLLSSLSTREMSVSEGGSSVDFPSERSSGRPSYWESPHDLRKELISSFLDDASLKSMQTSVETWHDLLEHGPSHSHPSEASLRTLAILHFQPWPFETIDVHTTSTLWWIANSSLLQPHHLS